MLYRVLKILTCISFLFLLLPGEKISPPIIIYLPLSLVSGNFFYGCILIYSLLFLLLSSFINLPKESDSWISISIVLFMYKCVFSWVDMAYVQTIHIVLFIVFGLLSISLIVMAVKKMQIEDSKK